MGRVFAVPHTLMPAALQGGACPTPCFCCLIGSCSLAMPAAASSHPLPLPVHHLAMQAVALFMAAAGMQMGSWPSLAAAAALIPHCWVRRCWQSAM